MKIRLSFYYVGDIEDATRLYSRFLNSEPTAMDQGWVRFELQQGDFALHLDPQIGKTEANSPIRFGAVVSFAVPDMQQALTRARLLGFRQVGEVQVMPYGEQAEIRDPWGNRLSLIEPAPGNQSTPRRRNTE